MIILFVVKYDSNEEINMEIMFKGADNMQDMIDRVYKNEYFKKAITLWLPFLKKRGFLDALIKVEGKKFEVKEVEEQKTEEKPEE